MAAIHESLISFKYWTPFVTSTNKLGPFPNNRVERIVEAYRDGEEDEMLLGGARCRKVEKRVRRVLRIRQKQLVVPFVIDKTTF